MKAFISSQFSYCLLIWMFHSRNLNNKISRIHEQALRLVYQNNLRFSELLDLDNSVTVHQKYLQALVTESYEVYFWHRGVVVINTAQLHSTKPELRFCAGSNPARGVSEIRDGEDL